MFNTATVLLFIYGRSMPAFTGLGQLSSPALGQMTSQRRHFNHKTGILNLLIPGMKFPVMRFGSLYLFESVF